MGDNNSSQPPPKEGGLNVIIAGAGIAGNVVLRQLLHHPAIGSLHAYEARPQDKASPPGLNVLMNHNGLYALRQVDPDLYTTFTQLGRPMVNWSARTVTGEALYDLPDVVEGSGEALVPAQVARWSEIHQATRVDAHTTFGAKVVRVEPMEIEEDPESGTGKLKVLIESSTTDEEECDADKDDTKPQTTSWIENVDILIAADGRYSAIRQQLAPSPTYYGPPYVADFRIVAPQQSPEAMALLPDDVPMWRLYNKPTTSNNNTSKEGLMAAFSGWVRVGMMRLDATTLGIFGNVKLPDSGVLHPEIQTAATLVALFTPSETPDPMGQWLLDVLHTHGDTAYWARKQETATCYSALNDRVLFCGDSAGAIYPSLGQGANLCLEDAAVTAACFTNVQRIAQYRTPRRNFIQRLSRDHARHIYEADYFATEVENWRNPSSGWRRQLRELWSPTLLVRAQVATSENFAPFGQLLGESLDGNLYDPQTDAVLDLSQGIPRLYYMKLTGGRPLHADRITRHNHVTQCLGALGADEWFYLMVHAPTPDRKIQLHQLQAFAIPPRHFVKLHVGTWHVGPMWSGTDLDRTFINLELSDTNEVDHDTVEFANLVQQSATATTLATEEEGNEHDLSPLFIPVFPVRSL